MKKLFMIICFSLLILSCKETKDSRMLGDENAGKTLIGWYYYNLGEERYSSLNKYLDEESFSGAKKAFAVNFDNSDDQTLVFKIRSSFTQDS